MKELNAQQLGAVSGGAAKSLSWQVQNAANALYYLKPKALPVAQKMLDFSVWLARRGL